MLDDVDDLTYSGGGGAGWREVQRYVPEPHRVATDETTTPREQWWDRRGHRVHLDRYGPPAAAARLLVLHGGGGNGRLVGALAAVAAARAGYAAVCPDLPGYGLTRVPDRRAVRYGDWVACARDLLRAESAHGPVVVAGFSLGGLLAYDAVSSVGAAGLVASSLLDPRDPLVRRCIARRPMGDLGAALLPRLRRLDRLRVPVRWLAPVERIAADARLARLLAGDPTAGGAAMPLGWFRTFLGSAPDVEPEDFDRCPVVLAHPAADRWTPVEASLRFLHRIPARHRRVVLLERAGHLPVERPGIDQLAAVVVELLDRAAGAAGPPTPLTAASIRRQP
jgi:alpha-beta hydrolase superfamily lysophospholipase